ncbi:MULTISPECIES: UDP-4-amino-4,6-dideoxy-N-acetyl-beta-L-altrosamine transaminase [Nitrospirillum]|uniref:UDP-4-amino-4, 6-dideoxy-N-acetyl-beta-L-altrosamine transaminase n=1 Tax=Nitrospirillum amazonense TaxID=28077 RepID=A0A560FUS4_9PROT|nr:UDP-4-amino-4,6-dideoxy-N-acetyl-beta-L-altrosamine transaminase [Nitrospirillum amazonense]MEC4592578.1 UDP-4-amino-4,6-dideoxy-N-acetyl-beta-L-altrosamine transaminase [Nitrospirillum amazonense]TWB25364.1 UDP-4-amino-4,6-dideoxy-N-acetyl-beta-L-altrosamine transaminase [Nitrospirillum amazonense]
MAADIPSVPSYLPYGRQAIDEDDIAAVTAVLRGDWLTQGPTVTRFEQAFAQAVGARHAVACANGTAALHLACMALDLQPGDAVVVPAVTFLATANAARYCGAEVAFADVDPETGLMRRADAEAAIARAEAAGWRVRALAPVHFAGQAADLDALGDLAEARGLAIIEDACHAVGSRRASRAGATGDGETVAIGACDRSAMACFSFHPVKTIAAGEGGMVTTNDDGLARSLRRDVSHGMVRDPGSFQDRKAAFGATGAANPWYYEMPAPGYNYRLTDIHAALGLSQLGKLDRFARRRAEMVARYDERLAPLAPLIRHAGRSGGEPAWHLYVVLIDFAALGRDRAAVMAALKAQGVGSQVHYIPVHHQPYYRERYGSLDLPGADGWYQACLSLPLFPAMTDGDVDRVVAALEHLVRA